MHDVGGYVQYACIHTYMMRMYKAIRLWCIQAGILVVMAYSG